jgi:hypothetical protein
MWDLEKIGFWIGVISGILALFTFLFGISNIKELFKSWSRKKPVESSSETSQLIEKTENIDFTRLPNPSAELVGRIDLHTLSDKKIYFSYAWANDGETHEEIVEQLYDFLKQNGYQVIRDKVDLGYCGLISNFMKEIGKGDLIVVVISDKYVRSPYCMFELYEIARNNKFDKSLFSQTVLPIRVDRHIDFSKPRTLEDIFNFWEKEEKQWAELVKKHANKISSEQFKRYERIKLIHNHIGELGDWLQDMNSLTLELLSQDNFAEITKIIQKKQ